MARFNLIKNSFLGGEVSPRLYGRTDRPEYQHSCKILKNFIPYMQGGATKRPGTRYMGAETATAHLVPFNAADGSHYCIAVSSSSDWNCYLAQDGSVVGVFHMDGASTKNYSSTIINLFKEDIHYAQAADVLWLTHPTMEPQLVFLVAGSFERYSLTKAPDSYTGVKPWARIPFMESNVAGNGKTVQLSAATVGTGRTMTAVGFTFHSSQVGSFWKVTHSGAPSTHGIVQITAAVTGASTATVTVIEALSATTTTDDFAESAWSDYRGWPRTVTFYDTRSVFGGNTTFPDTVWYSYGENYYLFYSLTSNGDSDPVTQVMPSQALNQTQWLASRQVLIAGTSGAEYVNSASQPGEPITPTDRNSREQTSHGGRHIMPVKKGNSVLFVGRNGRRLLEFQFYFDSDSFQAEDVAVTADHLTSRVNGGGYGAMRRLALDESRGVIWALDNEGKVIGVTRDKKNQLAAWHWHDVGGTVDSLCSIPTSDGLADEIWMLVVRSINSVTKYYVEKLGRDHEIPYTNTLALDPFFANTDVCPMMMDCSVVKTPGSTTVTGLSHLEGKEVQVLADGLYVGTKTVASGQITLADSADVVVVGIPYEGYIQTLDLDVTQPTGSAAAQIGRVSEVTIRFDKTVGGYVGDGTNWEEIPFDQATTPADPIPFYTGDKRVHYPGNYERGISIHIKHDTPFPCTVVSVITKGIINEG